MAICIYADPFFGSYTGRVCNRKSFWAFLLRSPFIWSCTFICSKSRLRWSPSNIFVFCLHEDVLSVSTVQLGVVFDAGARGAVCFHWKRVESDENLRFIDLQDGDTAKFHTTAQVWQTCQASPVPFRSSQQRVFWLFVNVFSLPYPSCRVTRNKSCLNGCFQGWRNINTHRRTFETTLLRIESYRYKTPTVLPSEMVHTENKRL